MAMGRMLGFAGVEPRFDRAISLEDDMNSYNQVGAPRPVTSLLMMAVKTRKLALLS